MEDGTLKKNSRIYIAGHTGLFGCRTVELLQRRGYSNLLLVSHSSLDLTRQKDVEAFFMAEQPEYIFFMCGLVGGIQANSAYMADFALENLMMSVNIINAAHITGVKKLLYLGSSCSYPVNSPQPVKEDYLLTGAIEPTNEGYALSKIMGIRLCAYYRRQYGDNFISCIPANVYGPGDRFDEEAGHVIPALMKRFYVAKKNNEKEVLVWGSGKPQREFLYIDDAVEACIFLMENYNQDDTINVGTGISTSIKTLAEEIAKVVGYDGQMVFDITKPDGMTLRKLDNAKISELGWKAKTSLEEGLKQTYDWFLKNRI